MFLFIGSKNSTLNLNYFRDHSDATLSPWIYEENTFVKYIKPIIPEWLLRKRERRYFSGGIGRINEDRKLNIAYKLDMSTQRRQHCPGPQWEGIKCRGHVKAATDPLNFFVLWSFDVL